MKNTIIIIIYIFTIVNLNKQTYSQNTISVNQSDTMCKTQHPVLLVHGIGYRDDIKFYLYWGIIPKVLKKNGCNVFLSHQNAFGTHSDNAEQIKQRILKILEQTKAERINIIAHSKGGIECRYLISKLDMADKVSSLTTIATPHRGSILANHVLHFLCRWRLAGIANLAVKLYAKILGDVKPNPLEAAKQLTPEYMTYFNDGVKNMEGVYYQSYGGMIDGSYPRFIGRLKQKLIYKTHGDNDGVVPVSSFIWGDYRGIVSSGNSIGVSHLEIIGVTRVSGFQVEQFYIDMVAELKRKGF